MWHQKMDGNVPTKSRSFVSFLRGWIPQCGSPRGLLSAARFWIFVLGEWIRVPSRRVPGHLTFVHAVGQD